MQNFAVAVFGMIFVGKIEQKQAILCPFNINFLFIELLYKINIIFVIKLFFGGKTALVVW